MKIVIYNLGDFIAYYDTSQRTCYGRIISILRVDKTQDRCIKIERIIEFNSLPPMLKSQQRRIASHKGYLWMTDETLVINPAKIKSKVNIWLSDINKPNNYQYAIYEIVYCVNTRWTMRSIDL